MVAQDYGVLRLAPWLGGETALFDGPALPDRQSGEPVLRYRGVAYRRSELTRPRRAEASRLMYRGVAYRPAAAAPAPDTPPHHTRGRCRAHRPNPPSPPPSILGTQQRPREDH